MAKSATSHPRGRTDDKQPNPLDVYFGERMRLRRTALGYSQQFLARQLGITFQQVQKYEKGVNRAGWSRACDIADVLGTSLDFFRAGIDPDDLAQSPMRLCRPEDGVDPAADLAAIDPMLRSETLELVEAYYSINNPKIAANVLNLVKSMAHSSSSLPREYAPVKTRDKINQLIDEADNRALASLPEQSHLLDNELSLRQTQNHINRMIDAAAENETAPCPSPLKIKNKISRMIEESVMGESAPSKGRREKQLADKSTDSKGTRA